MVDDHELISHELDEIFAPMQSRPGTEFGTGEQHSEKTHRIRGNISEFMID